MEDQHHYGVIVISLAMLALQLLKHNDDVVKHLEYEIVRNIEYSNVHRIRDISKKKENN